MILDKQLIEKTYYETFLKDDEVFHPIHVLGETYYQEINNDESQLAYIRFAQGEIYYHNKDFEAAIFKWEQVSNDLQDWAKKNIADALFELGKLTSAEETYKSITTESKTLSTEVSLQLFSLYLVKEDYSKADDVIRKVVTNNPDYVNVTSLARKFYETQQDWKSAVELSVGEVVRTESVEWADMLHRYIESGHTFSMEPSYFQQVLVTLYKVDVERFIQLASSFWKTYRGKTLYLQWLQSTNDLFLQIEVHPYESWNEIADLFHDTYLELLSGNMLIATFKNIMPNFLQNWIKFADTTQSLFASAALLAWEQIFPSSIHPSSIQNAEHLIYQSELYKNSLEDSLHLFDKVVNWAEQNDVSISYKWKWLIEQLLDFDTYYLLLAGTNTSGKSSVMNKILGETVVKDPSTHVVYFRNDVHTDVLVVTDNGETSVDEVTANETSNGLKNVYIDWKLPSRFLNKNNVTLIDTPSMDEIQADEKSLEYVPFADTLLFVLHAHLPFTDQERDMILHIQEQAPYLPIHFLLNKAEAIQSDTTLEEIEGRIHTYFPNAHIIPFTSEEQIKDVAAFVQVNGSSRDIKTERIGQIIRTTRRLLTYLLEKRVEAENELIESIKWNEEIVVKLNGFINNVASLEKDKSTIITQSYKSIKEQISADLMEQIPKILHECGNQLSIDSDFQSIHKELNQAMNESIQNYVTSKVMPKFVNLILDWINTSKEEFIQSQAYLDEMTETFNSLYNEERMHLQSDFKVLDDWSRDIDRIMRRVRIDDMNILLRFTPELFILKNSSKLFGRFQRSKNILYNQYKKYMEQNDFAEIKDAVISKFFEEFELFERAIEQDVTLFFREPVGTLKRMVEETHVTIQESRDTLNNMRANPELYHDPITLYKVQLRQQEMMWNVGKFPQVEEVEESI